MGAKYFVNGPRLHEFLHEINKDVLSNYDCMTVGETVFTTLEDARLLEKLISDCGLIVFPNCSHYAYLENLGQVINILNNFLVHKEEGKNG